MTLGVNRNARMPRPKGARPPFGLLRDVTIHPAQATLRLPNAYCVVATRRWNGANGTILYCLINLAIALIALHEAQPRRMAMAARRIHARRGRLVNGWSIPRSRQRRENGVIVLPRRQSRGRRSS